MDKRYSISEVSEIFNITTNKIRFYEKKGILQPQRDRENNYRYYTKDDILKLQTILIYRMIGVPIEDLKDIMGNYQNENLLKHFHNQWSYINDELHRLRLIKACLEDMMEAVYDQNVSLENDFHEKIATFAQKTSNLQKVKNSWKDRWNFDDWAENYDQSVRSSVGQLGIYQNYERILDNVYNKSIENKNMNIKILEIGVGTGNLAKKFLCSGYDIIGIDQSRQMLNVAKRKFPNLKLRVGEFLKIPYENNTFDVIVSTYAFHHLNNEEKQIASDEMVRVLKKGGRIVIGDLMFENQRIREEIYKTLSKDQINEIEDEYYSNIESLNNVFKSYGMCLEFLRVDLLNYVITVE
ncbi:MerR family transcriptional regulator [Anaerosolibacter sp.]|uniref:MerR family transcriptional regulator n=1 Tax=Anaerosolibacter sp. TaxID=1872527 RepID=UPI0039F01168